jgi:[pyruvate, water dikinase]-phosphate phosphotransferase / [pyruvate, water dikinase] kinase
MLVRRKREEVRGFSDSADDGLHQELLTDADVVIVGPSGSGKSSVKEILVGYGIKVADVPTEFVRDENSLKDMVERGWPLIVGLDCSPKEVLERRRQSDRYKKISMDLYGVNYAEGPRRFVDTLKTSEDVDAAAQFYINIKCKCIDARKRTPQEIAEKILGLLPAPIAAAAKMRRSKAEHHHP